MCSLTLLCNAGNFLTGTNQVGWALDPVSNMLICQPATFLAAQKLDSSKLQNLTEYVFHLEH